MEDRIYFTCNCAPNGQDWMRGSVSYSADGHWVYVRTMNGSPQAYTFPSSNIQRIEHGR